MDKDPFAENCPRLTMFCVRSMNIFHTSGCISFIFCSSSFSRPSSIVTSENSVLSCATLKLFPADHIEINETCKYLAGQQGWGRFGSCKYYPGGSVLRPYVRGPHKSNTSSQGGRWECSRLVDIELAHAPCVIIWPPSGCSAPLHTPPQPSLPSPASSSSAQAIPISNS